MPIVDKTGRVVGHRYILGGGFDLVWFTDDAENAERIELLVERYEGVAHPSCDRIVVIPSREVARAA